MNWALIMDLTLYLVPPTKRSSASAVQVSFGHALGDAVGPYIVGALSDWGRGNKTDPLSRFYGLRNAFYLPNILIFLSGIFFTISVFTLHKDLQKVKDCKYTKRYNKFRIVLQRSQNEGKVKSVVNEDLHSSISKSTQINLRPQKEDGTIVVKDDKNSIEKSNISKDNEVDDKTQIKTKADVTQPAETHKISYISSLDETQKLSEKILILSSPKDSVK